MKVKNSSLLCRVKSDGGSPVRPLASAERSACCWMERVGHRVSGFSRKVNGYTFRGSVSLRFLVSVIPLCLGEVCKIKNVIGVPNSKQAQKTPSPNVTLEMGAVCFVSSVDQV